MGFLQPVDFFLYLCFTFVYFLRCHDLHKSLLNCVPFIACHLFNFSMSFLTSRMYSLYQGHFEFLSCPLIYLQLQVGTISGFRNIFPFCCPSYLMRILESTIPTTEPYRSHLYASSQPDVYEQLVLNTGINFLI